MRRGTIAFDYCNGVSHYVTCPHDPPYTICGPDCPCGSWHIWFGNSPALCGGGVGTCPNFKGNYAAPRTRCKTSSWEAVA